MKNIAYVLGLPLFILLVGCSGANQTIQPANTPTATSIPTPEEQVTKTLFMAHYMPWYQTPEISGYWGWHWKMDHFDPKQTDEKGYPQIASHYMPLTGPYDSKDPDILEYQMLLMKMSGIDGVIVDWYGSSNYIDYPVVNQATQKLFEAVKKAGLLFSICYEDRTVKVLLDDHRLDLANVYQQGQEDLAFLESNWFQEAAYLKAPAGPVLFNFGPQYFINGGDWERLFEKLQTRPVLVTLDQHFVPSASGTFPWPPMYSSQNGVLSQAALENYLDSFYQKAKNYKYKVAGAFPGFHDIYQEAGVSNSYGYLDAQDGKIFELTLQKAIEQNPDVIQLITWNDYGEGTIIEPTVQFGYQYLEMIQEARAQMDPSAPVFNQDDLHLALSLFQLRKQNLDNQTQAKLDEAFDLIIAGEASKAAEILTVYP